MGIKRVMSLILAIMFAINLSSCEILDGQGNNDISKTESIRIKGTNTKKLSEYFISSLINGDYVTTGRMIGATADNPYFTVSDVEWYVPQSNYKNVVKFAKKR